MRDDSGRGDGPDAADSSDAESSEWRFSIADLEEDEEEAPESNGADAEGAESDGEGNVAGEFAPSESVEPGSPSRRNAIWVAVGAYITVLALVQLFGGSTGLGARDLLVVTGGVVLVTLVVMGFFGLLTPDT